MRLFDFREISNNLRVSRHQVTSREDDSQTTAQPAQASGGSQAIGSPSVVVSQEGTANDLSLVAHER